MIEAAYFDGLTSRRHAVQLRLEDDAIRICGAGIERRVPLASVRVSERLGSAPRKLEFGDATFCEVVDHAALQPFLDAAGFRDGLVDRLQRSWPATMASLAALVLIFAAGYLWGLPWVAERLAQRMPEPVTRLLSAQTLELLDETWLRESALPRQRQQALRDGFARLQQPSGAVTYRLYFRASPAVGPNAFALPDGSIILLDELVALADDDRQILAVLAHELGHVHHRHGLRLMIQNTIVGAAAAFWFGDTSSLLAGIPAALAQAHYSRGLESEADRFGAAMLRANRLDPEHLAVVLEKLARHEQAKARSDASQKGWTDYLSTHPAPASRIEALRNTR